MENIENGMMFQTTSDDGTVWYQLVVNQHGTRALVTDLFTLTPAMLKERSKELGFSGMEFIGSCHHKESNTDFQFFPVLRPVSVHYFEDNFEEPYLTLDETQLGKFVSEWCRFLVDDRRLLYRESGAPANPPGYWNNEERCREFLRDCAEHDFEWITDKYNLSINSVYDRRRRCEQFLKAGATRNKKVGRALKWTPEAMREFLLFHEQNGFDATCNHYKLKPFSVSNFLSRFRKRLKELESNQ